MSGEDDAMAAGGQGASRASRASGPGGRDAGPDEGVDSAGMDQAEVDKADADPDEAARIALARARDAARAKGLRPGSAGTRTRRKGRQGSGHDPATVHGAGRDPQLLGSMAEQLSRHLGWTESLSVGGVIGRWPEVVGDQIAAHCTPVTFDEGDLVVQADSTAWATQIKLLMPQLERRLAEEVGEGVVTSIRVLGPGGPSWRKGPRSVRGRGPRDTYG